MKQQFYPKLDKVATSATPQLPLHASKAIFGVIKDNLDQQIPLKQGICL